MFKECIKIIYKNGETKTIDTPHDLRYDLIFKTLIENDEYGFFVIRHTLSELPKDTLLFQIYSLVLDLNVENIEIYNDVGEMSYKIIPSDHIISYMIDATTSKENITYIEKIMFKRSANL